MQKRILFYTFSTAILLGVLFFFLTEYNSIRVYSELTYRHNKVYAAFQNLSKQINNAAILNPALLKASRTQTAGRLFFTDSLQIVKQLDFLVSTVRDSINVKIAGQLDTLLRQEISWLLESNVPDSIVRNQSSEHLIRFIHTDSLINTGIERTAVLIELRKQQSQAEMNSVRNWMLVFILLSGTLLIYTTIILFKQRAKKEKLEEQQVLFASIVDSSDDAILSKDLNGYITSWNRGAVSIFGYSREEIIGRHISIVIPDHLLSEEILIIEKIRSGQVVDHYETKRIRKDKVIIDVSLTISPLKDTQGRIIGASKIVQNITVLKNAQRNIEELNKDLEAKIAIRTEQLNKSNEALEAFSYSVSHDLRAPLRGIIGFTSILEESYGNLMDEEGKRITSIIKKNTLKMGQLIDDLLRFSKLGKQEILKESIDTGSLVYDVIRSMNIKDGAVTWKIASLPEIRADGNTIRQVWVNLLSNAVKYSETKQTPEISIGYYRDEKQVVFFVKDNGVGFDEQYSQKLFKVFQRLHSSRQFEGTGVGLAIVEKIITRHEGRVWATGKVDKGATFYFSLPDP